MNVLKWLGCILLAVLLVGVVVGGYFLLVASITVIASAAMIVGTIAVVAMAIRASFKSWRRRKV